MAGAWELRNQHVVQTCILHVDVTTVAWAFALRDLIIPGPPPIGVTGMPFDHGRNSCAMRCLEVGATHLFFLDSDVAPPRDAVLKLLAHDQPIISGMYCRRSPPHAVPVMIKGGSWHTQFPMGSVQEVDFVGAGCLLIKREVLENFPPLAPGRHWFEWRVDKQGILPPGECLSEDFAFCAAARQKLGYKILVDTSIRCKHIGYAEADYGLFGPLGSIPAA